MILVCIVLLAAGCSHGSSIGTGSHRGTDATTGPRLTTTSAEARAPDPTAEIMAAAAHQLVTVDNTFGSGSTRFSTILVQDRTNPTAGSSDGSSGADSRPLTDTERGAIEHRLISLGEVRWIDDPTDYRTKDLVPTIEGSVIIGLGEPTIDTDTARVAVSLWCGGLCGTGLTYSLAQDAAGAWTVGGIVGPVAIS